MSKIDCPNIKTSKGTAKIEVSDAEVRDLIVYAFRYAHPRMSAAPSTVAEIIFKNLRNFSIHDLKLFSSEITDAYEFGMLGMKNIDEPMWLHLKDKIEEELKGR